MTDNENSAIPDATTAEPVESSEPAGPLEPTEQRDSAELPPESTVMSKTMEQTEPPDVIPESSEEPLTESVPSKEPVTPTEPVLSMEPSTEPPETAEPATLGEVPFVAGDTKKSLSVFSDESYACDRQYAIVLAQFITYRDREKVHAWLKRLDTMNKCDDERAERDLYLKFLTLSLNHGKLVPPFNKLPMPGLRPLSTVMPRSVHNLIYKGKYVTGECRPPEESVDRTYTPAEEIEPGMFFSRQPVPKDGSVVYAAAFSTKNP